jgi:hypothetical protein
MLRQLRRHRCIVPRPAPRAKFANGAKGAASSISTAKGAARGATKGAAKGAVIVFTCSMSRIRRHQFEVLEHECIWTLNNFFELCFQQLDPDFCLCLHVFLCKSTNAQTTQTYPQAPASTHKQKVFCQVEVQVEVESDTVVQLDIST